VAVNDTADISPPITNGSAVALLLS